MAKSKNIQDVESKYEQEKEYTQPLSNQYGNDIFDALEPEQIERGLLTLLSIVPDVTQPRRILPIEVRAKWDGTPEGYDAVISAWEDEVLESTDGAFPTLDILAGKVSPISGSDDALVIEFGKIVGLAASIRDIGLKHPIGVVKRGELYRIIDGERRWTAYRFLRYFLKTGWDAMPANIANVTDWELTKAQAAGNSQNDPLNAISKARMFAKLLMIARAEGGEHYDSWNQLVVECDRPWYAQVANGEIHRIPRGMGPQFEQALNITVEQMRHYRNLLRITENHEIDDALWQLGDKGSWAERFLREIGQYLEPSIIRQILDATDGYTVTTVTVSRTEEVLREAVESAKKAAELAKKQAERDAPQPDEEEPEDDEIGAVVTRPSGDWVSLQWVGKMVYAGSLKVEVVGAVGPQLVSVKTDDGDEVEVHIAALRPYDGAESPFNVDDRVYVAGHGAGVIRYVKDGKYGVYLDSSGSTHYYPAAQLSLIEASPLNPPATQGEDSDNADTPNPDGLVPENWVGKAVKSPVNGEIGLVTTDDGDYVRVKWSRGYYSNHTKDALTVVNYQLWIDALKPKDWTGLYVQTVVGAVAGVVKDNGADVDLIYPDKTPSKSAKQFLSLVDKREWDEAVQIHQAAGKVPTQTVQTGLEKSAYQAQGHGLTTVQLVTKPVLFEGKPAIVVGSSGSENIVIQVGKDQLTVHKDMVTLHEVSNGQRLKDFSTSSTTNDDDDDYDDDDEVILPSNPLIPANDRIRDVLNILSSLALETDHDFAVEAIEAVLTMPNESSGAALGKKLTLHYDHIERLCEDVQEMIHNRFAALVGEVNHGAD